MVDGPNELVDCYDTVGLLNHWLQLVREGAGKKKLVITTGYNLGYSS